MSERQCEVCGIDISYRGPQALYCRDCANEKKREAVRRQRTKPHHHAQANEALGGKARRLYAEWRAEGLTRQQIDALLVDLRCLHDMERDAVAYAPTSAIGSAAASLLEA